MRLAVCITVFNGLELLEKCIVNFLPMADYIILCYQEISHSGRRNDKVRPFVIELCEKYDCIILNYNPNVQLGVKENERLKHQKMIDKAKETGCTHFIMGATDHFYNHNEVKWAKNYVEENDHDVTFTKMFTYYKYPTWRLTPIEDYHMPFICKLRPDTSIQKNSAYPVYVDPSVKVLPIRNHHVFDEADVMLHHFSMVRDDLKENKFLDAVSPVWTPGLMEKYLNEFNNYDIEKNPGVSYFKGRKIKVVENIFNL